VNRAFSAGPFSGCHQSWDAAPGSPRPIRPLAD